MASITFIRHAESQANADGIWAGRSDGPLSAGGEASLALLAGRMQGRHFDVVASSPLQRARHTAASFAPDFEVWDELIEMDLGRWDGSTIDQIMANDEDRLREAVARRDLPLGVSGESLDEVTRRAFKVVDELAARLGDDGRAAVVTHGGFLQNLLRRHLAGKERRVHAFVENTALTTIMWQHGRARLATFNDTCHLGPRGGAVRDHLSQGHPVVALVRHGRTQANVETRWQGHSDWGLDQEGHRQASALADWYGRVGTVYSSPLGRARSTAEYLASGEVVTVDGLREIGMGEWEGLTTDQVVGGWPDLIDTIHRDRVDLRRGESGESWGELTFRMRNALATLRPAIGAPTVVVSHGGAIRSYVSSLTAVGDTHAESLFTPPNTSVTHIALTEQGPYLIDYALAWHLEGLS